MSKPRSQRARDDSHAGPVTAASPAGPAATDAERIRARLLAGDEPGAARLIARLIGDSFGLAVSSVAFTLDEYSLNSVSGRVRLAGGTVRFFKFHTESGETSQIAEYYRGELLAAAGLPVEQPIAVSTVPGRQIALYELRTQPRLADVCADLERQHGRAARLPSELLAARRALDQVTGQVLVATLRPPQPSSAAAAIHQLFHGRLAEPSGDFPGARYRDWYTTDPRWEDLAPRRWVVNGVEYRSCLAELTRQAAALLEPRSLAAADVVTAHGDDHQGNVWVMDAGQGKRALRLFDPAFAGADIPALLAPVKATFHNCLAHPFWLYHPGEAVARSTVTVATSAGTVSVTDDAALSPLRREILDSAAEHVWAPLLAALSARGRLPGNWRAVVRAALLCCPLLVTNLISPARPGPVHVLGLSRAVMAGSEPAGGQDVVTAFLDRITPAGGAPR